MLFSLSILSSNILFLVPKSTVLSLSIISDIILHKIKTFLLVESTNNDNQFFFKTHPGIPSVAELAEKQGFS